MQKMVFARFVYMHVSIHIIYIEDFVLLRYWPWFIFVAGASYRSWLRRKRDGQLYPDRWSTGERAAPGAQWYGGYLRSVASGQRNSTLSRAACHCHRSRFVLLLPFYYTIIKPCIELRQNSYNIYLILMKQTKTENWFLLLFGIKYRYH